MLFNEKNNKGIANEIKFASLLDKKLIKELEPNVQELLYNLFDEITETDYVECWKSKYIEKADIRMKINNDIKGISIKMGKSNSVHQEHITEFTNYLLNIGISQRNVSKLKNYIFGIIDGIQFDAKTYKLKRQNDILELKNAFADFYTKTCLIIRFLFRGKETQHYDADAIIYGTPDNFYWATKSEILKYLINYPDGNTINVKVGPLFIQCRNRNLKKNIYAKDAEEFIQVKWYNLKKDLYYITKKRKECQKAKKYINN